MSVHLYADKVTSASSVAIHIHSVPVRRFECATIARGEPTSAWRAVAHSVVLAVLALFSTAAVGIADQMQPAVPFAFGYTQSVSYAAGDEVAFHLSSSESKLTIRVFRLGPTSELVWEQADVPSSPQVIPDRASSHGCNWPVSAKVVVPPNWRSGYYQAQLSAPGLPKPSLVHFIVRASQPGTSSKILIQLATNTYNAYTNWGGHSLYAYHDRDGVQGHRVSFLRPQSSQFENWEGPFVRWAESNGFQLEYAANSDLELQPQILSGYRLVLSVGHDEYWSSKMRDHLEKFISDGGNVAFFSGNTCCWQVRSEEDGKALTCWKQWYNVDPMYRTEQEHLLSTLWSHHLVGRPENQLTGVGFLFGGYHRSHGQYMDGSADYEVHRPDHWLFEGTSLKRGDRFGGKDTIVGYECDGCEMKWVDGLPEPTHRDGTPENFVILASCPARWAPADAFWYDRFPKDREGAAVVGMYIRNGTVVTVGSTDWAHGLAGGDRVVQQITTNVLKRLSR